MELSAIGLKFRANLVAARDVTRALEPVHRVLVELARDDLLDEKLAEYAFFPLTHIFNQTQQASVRCLELAVKCLQILVEKGWREKLSAQMGKQLLILLTILAGGSPGQSQNPQSSHAKSEELSMAAFDSIGAVCRLIKGQEATSTIFNEVGTATVVDQAVYVFLEAIVDGPADGVQVSAARALQALHSRVTDRVVLASLMPRTVSSLTKALRSMSQTRRSYKLLSCCLEILTEDLRVMLNDVAVSTTDATHSKAGNSGNADAVVLDQSWLSATVSQVKLALANIVHLRNHDRWEVRHALFQLCVMIVEECQKSLEDSLPMAIETLVVLSESDGPRQPNQAYTTLRHLTASSDHISNLLKSGLHSWIVALPRLMQGNDDSAKQRAIRQISAAFQILSEVQRRNKIIEDTMTTSLCDSVSAAISVSSNVPQPLEPDVGPALEVDTLNDSSETPTFAPVLLGHGSQKDTLAELKSMIATLNSTDANLEITRSMLSRLHNQSGSAFIAPFWLALSFLKSLATDVASFDDILDLGAPGVSSSKGSLVEELYSIALPILTDVPTANPDDWRVPALALETVALQAQQLGDSFRPELIDSLYPVLQLMGSSNPALKNHAMTCLTIMTSSCGYANASTMLVENVDYLVNAVALKLNTFDVSPQAPQVLLMMVRLCGARLIPFLDDLVGSVFAVLDAFHGYPKLVELLFAVLGAIVDEGSRTPSVLAIGNSENDQPVNHRKRPQAATSITDLSGEFRRFREKRNRTTTLEDESAANEILSHPKRAWSAPRDSGLERPDDEDDPETSSEADQSPSQKEEEEKPHSKSHTLLLNIIKSIPPHLSSPSPFLRRSLLSILTRGLPILAQDENSFLPLINDLWASVSARITLPQESFPQSSSLSTSLASPDPAPTNADEAGIQEETYVTIASCTAIATMCKGAGDFMSSRVEQDFPQWKKLYVRLWDRVRQDSEKAAERQRLHLKQHHLNEASRAVSSQMEHLSLNGSKSASTTETTHSSVQPFSSLSTANGYTNAPPPPSSPPPRESKAHTPQHALFQALTSLFTTLISHVRLPADIADDIAHCLGSRISFYYPNYYFSFSWRSHKVGMGSGDAKSAASPSAGTSTSDDGATTQSADDDVDAAIRAMDAWNPDLTWLIFARGRTSRSCSGVTTPSGFSQAKRRMDERVVKEMKGKRFGGGEEDNGIVEDAVQQQPLRFAEAVF